VVVALDKYDYIQKIEFANSNTYENLRRNPNKKIVNKIITKLKLLLKGWKYYGYLSDYNYNNLNCTIPILPLAYGLPKIQKFTSFLHKIINKSLPPANIVALQLIVIFWPKKFQSNFKIPAEASFLSLDIISFTLLMRRHLIEKNTSIPKRKFFKALELVLNLIFFEIDNIALAYNASNIDTLVNTFNSFHPRLKFITEIDEDKLNFLDVSLIRKGNSLIHNWYHKSTFSDRYLNYFSFFVPIYHQENFELIIKILLNNEYSLKLIFSEIKNRLHRFFTIPFISFLSEKIKKFVKKDPSIHMAYKGINNLRKFIRGHKDVRSKLTHTDIVCKINCRDYETSYVGQTSRCLKTRINEYRNHINWNATQHSVITEHRISHDFDWENVKILDEERVLNKRLIL
ncbi:hypothetical protein ALC56_14069, partial [Trachymyrmex septentrionalis]